MRKYIITIGVVLCTTVIHAGYPDNRLERIEEELKDAKDARFYDALRRGDTQSALDNI